MKYFISILTILAILSLSLANAQERLSGKTVAAESAESIVRNMGRSTTPLLKSPDGGYQFLAKIEDNSQLDILKKAGLNYKQCDLPGWVSFSADTAIVEALRSHIYVEPRQVLHTCEFPNDSLLADQWWFTANNGMWESDVRKAWEVTQGSADIRVGIIGTGCPLKNGVWTHPDLDSSRFVFRSVFNNAYADSDKAITDWSGHETHVEGIISAIANNGIGIAGMDQLCKLFIYKASDPYGNLNNDDIANSIYQAVHDRCNVINMSFGGSLYSRMLEDAMFYAYKAGVICVVAAGNNGGEYQSFPAFFERFTTIPGLREGLNTIVTVGSIDKNSRLSYFSNRGWFVDLYAPGGGSNLKEGVISTLPTYNFILGDSTRGYPYQRKYGYLNGTSMAAPVVTGTVSLMSAANPKLKASQVRDILVGSATRIVSTAGTVLVCNPGDAVKSAKIGVITSVDLTTPTSFALHQNYPNPFNPATTISYTLPQEEHVQLIVYDVYGREIVVLIDQQQQVGWHQVNWDASKLSSGMYFYRLNVGSFTQVKKAVLLK